MTVHINGSKGKDLYYGGTKIKEAYYNGNKVYSSSPLYYCWKRIFGNYTYYIYSSNLEDPTSVTRYFTRNIPATNSSQLTQVYTGGMGARYPDGDLYT